ncbi:regulator of nonsense transcripts UPF3 isoform X2 [Corylus avellana]|uniref:regulator of nonsense transcripts UPF3 isoform X2 n=1 Tax=Corylus avellana TaxID=13451 RepID=UPI00286CD7A6|nr:regulator of nonsense transcripts UPF3 isoform X2 [Corylus avellana]
MKDPLERTKVVIRHLPPSLTQSDFFPQIDDKFSGRYNWFCFRPGKNSQKHQRYSRAYIDFKRPEDVFKFAEFFAGHVFVNEKGAQYKIVVEYAPSQRVRKPFSKKDSREGTIYKDPDYLEFLKIIAKPAENLPSAEIQLERKEAEQAGTAKEPPIVTPLMEYVRQKRAVDCGAQGSSVVGKIRRRAGAASPGKPGSSGTKRGSEKKKYILKESAKTTTQKNKSTFIVVARREDQPATSSGKKTSVNESVRGIEGSVSGIPVTADSGKKILLLKGKERGIPEGLLQQQGVTPPAGNSPASTAQRENQRREAGGRLIRSILLNNDAHQSQSSTAVQPQQKIQILSSETGKRPSRPVNARLGSNGPASKNESNSFGSKGDPKRTPDDKFTKKDLQGLGNVSEKQEKRTRNRDRPDRVWTPLHRSDVSHAIDEHLSSSVSHSTRSLSDLVEASHGEMKDLPHGSRTAEVTTPASGRNSSVENGSHRHVGRRGAAHILKDDGSLNMSEGKSPRRGVSGLGAHEKLVWVQKSSSGS